MIKRSLKLFGILILILLIAVSVAFLPGKNSEVSTEDRPKENFISEFFTPNKNKEGSNVNQFTDEDFIPEPDIEEQAKLKLQKVSSVPVAGYGVFMEEEFVFVEESSSLGSPVAPPTKFIPILRYVDRITGNIYQTKAEEVDERVISNTLVPGIKEALFTSAGESVIMRYLKEDGQTIATFVGSLPKHTLGGDFSIGEIQGSFMPDNIVAIDVAPEKEKIFYLVNTNTGVSGVITDKMGQNRFQVFDSPLVEWISNWSEQNNINITTKAAGGIPGYMYSIDAGGSGFDKVIGGINGMTTLPSNDTNLTLIGTDLLKLSVFDKRNNTLSDLRIKTLPEKCVWAKSNTVLYCAVPTNVITLNYPDSWYQGVVSFSDQIWKIDLFSGTEVAILNPAEVGGGEEIDAMSLKTDPSGEYLFFINKKDSFLWSLDLKED